MISAVLAKVVNVNLELNLKNVKLVREKALLILDKVLCKFKWAVLLVEELEFQIKILAQPVKVKELLIEHNKKQFKFQPASILVKIFVL